MSVNEAEFNCDCVGLDGVQFQTLEELRTRMMRRLGFSALATNPPPGMSELLDDFLQSAQRQLYQKNPVLNAERLFRWTMTPNIRYYGIHANDTDSDSCDVLLNPYQVTWVGIEDLNGAWLPLVQGINPTLYTTSQQPGLPACYEIRSCIEVFPAPAYAYTLWVKGNFDLLPFTEDEDTTTLDSELVFLYALGNAKVHYGQADAQNTLTQAGNYLLDLKAGKHMTKRYVPGTIKLPPAIQPIMTQWVPNP